MSIIYDALKKVENTLVNSQEAKGEKNLKPKPKPKSYLLVVLAVCLGFFIANILLKLQPPHPGPHKTIPSPLPLFKALSPLESAPIQTSSSLTLNGVYFSGDEGSALINNRLVKKGDKVNGATVLQIYLDEVELERNGYIIKLSNTAK